MFLGDHNRKEIIMFARKVSMHLKPDGVAEFTRKLEQDVIPLLRKQNGFQDEITFVATDRKEAFGISLWDRNESAETYNSVAYAEVASMQSTVIDATPQAETYSV